MGSVLAGGQLVGNGTQGAFKWLRAGSSRPRLWGYACQSHNGAGAKQMLGPQLQEADLLSGRHREPEAGGLQSHPEKTPI